MKCTKLRIFIRCLCTILFSVVCLQCKAYGLRGRVVDGSGINPLVGVNVKVKTDSVTVLLQTQTDVDGKFVFANLSQENITIEVLCMGYSPFSTSVRGNNTDLDLGVISLKPSSITLDEVTVTGNRTIELADKYLIFPTEQELKRTSELIELLNELKINMPGLKVNESQQTLYVDGGKPILMLNGKEVGMDKIRNIDHRRIQRIEYSNVSGIRYLDRGATGVINFIMNGLHDGGLVSVNTNNALTTFRNRANINGTYHVGKSEWSINYNTLWRKSGHEYTDKDERFVGRTDDIIRSQTGLPSAITDFDNSLTMDYTYTHSPSTAFMAMFGLKYHDKDDKEAYRIVERQGANTETFERRYYNERRLLTPSLDLFFKTAVANNQTLELNAVGTMSAGDYNRGLNDGGMYAQRNATKNKSINVNGEALYTLTFKRATTKVGLNYTHSHAQNDYSENGGVTLIDKLTKDNVYGYAIVTGTLRKIGYNLGIGLKHYRIGDLNKSKNFFNAKTTASLNYPLNKGWSVGYLFVLDSSLPPLSSFSDVVQTIDKVSLQVGNMNVQPSVVTRNRLSMNLHLDKFTISLQGNYNYTCKPIVSAWRYVADPSHVYHNMFIKKTENGDYDSRLNVECAIGWQNVFNHFTFQTVMGWDRFRMQGEGYHSQISKPYASVSLSAYWNKLSVYANFDMLPQYSFWGTNVYRGVRYNYVGMRYNMKHWTLGCRIDNPLNKDGFVQVSENISNINPTHTEYRIVDFANMVELSMQYRIRYGKEYKKGNRTLMNRSFDSGVNNDY